MLDTVVFACARYTAAVDTVTIVLSASTRRMSMTGNQEIG